MKNLLKKIVKCIKTKEKIPIIEIVDKEKILDGKVAVITGGSGGIGYSIAKKLYKSGAKIVLLGRNEEKLKKCCDELGENSKYLIVDLTNISQIKEKIYEIVDLFGKIDILVNSAGIHITNNNLNFFNVDEKDYDSVMNLNLKSTYFFCQEIAQYMVKMKIKGHILMISSNRAIEPSWSPYGLSKLALNGLTKGLAQELLKYGIIVNAIAPGPTATSMQNYENGMGIETNQNKIERYTMPEEIAEYALMLVSDLGNTIIGDTIYLTGGRGIIDIR